MQQILLFEMSRNENEIINDYLLILKFYLKSWNFIWDLLILSETCKFAFRCFINFKLKRKSNRFYARREAESSLYI